MINKLITIVLFAAWFKLFNVFFYSFLEIPVEFVTGEGVNLYKVYWIVFFVLSTFAGYKILNVLMNLNNKSTDAAEY